MYKVARGRAVVVVGAVVGGAAVAVVAVVLSTAWLRAEAREVAVAADAEIDALHNESIRINK